ncbi:MAG TPA: cyclic-di-AMP receptor [Candidatus Choladousia intestinigallinarum]|nr:cyclic-di-AMP receptor [Candidatus Choladousia intestinigallinarum]
MKMVMAILYKDDEEETTRELHANRFFVTKLSTTGGLLRRKNVTLLIVTEDENVPKVLEIIKNNSGERKTLSYINTASMPDRYGISSFPMVPVNIQTGGSTVFILNVEQFEKY